MNAWPGRGMLLVGLAAMALMPGARDRGQDVLPFRNADLPIEQRIDDLLARLTLDEKVSLMIERGAPIERLGIPPFPWWNEALHGVARAGRATVFPQAIGLAATWDTGLMGKVAAAIADEARAMHNRWLSRGQHHLYQGLVFWSPNLNIFRDPRWGRGQETYGEDPFLTGRLGVAFVRGMQGDDPHYLETIATPKHFAVHSGPEPLRHTFDARVSPLDLRDTYLPAFRAAIVDGGAASVMCAYNRVDGLPACANPDLLGTILRQEWRFTGYVVSDCGAVQDIYEHHRTAKTPIDGAALALRAGTDLECGSGSWSPGSPDAFLNLADAVRARVIDEGDVDQALRRLIRAQMRLGVYDPPGRVPFTALDYASVVNSPSHQALALDAARESIVLLKNAHDTLPLRRDLHTLAVIGPNANDVEVLLGNYNGTPIDPVSALRGIRAAVSPGTKVLYARGAPLAAGLPDLQVVPRSALTTAAGAPGLEGAYYRGHFDGAPLVTRADESVDFDWADEAPVEGLGEVFSVRWTGLLNAPATGEYTLGFRGATAFRVLVGDKVVVRGRTDHEPTLATGRVILRAGWSYPVRVEYEHEKYDAVGQLLWEVPGGRRDEAVEAVAAARAADTVVLILGLSSRLEGEEMSVAIPGFSGGDRTSLDLPAAQEALLETIVTAVPDTPIVLVLLSGGALAVGWANEHVPAILQAWYPGQSGGTAIADVLFGAVSPGGRLPVTVYRSVGDLPPFDDYRLAGRTYRYFTGQPLYPFGHGLSYARFRYDHLRVPARAATGEPVDVSVEVQNAGTMTADEVVQLYVSHEGAPAPVPVRALKGFARISLKPDERRVVRFRLSPRDLSIVDERGARLAEAGRLTIAVGGCQPGPAGMASAATTGVLSAILDLAGPTRSIDP